MQEEEQTKFCKNCEKEVPLSKFRMHEVQCYRLNTRCPTCNAVVLKSELDSHMAEVHMPKVELPEVEQTVTEPIQQPLKQDFVQPIVPQSQLEEQFPSFPIEEELPALSDEAAAQKLNEEENERLIAQLLQDEILANEGPGRIPASSMLPGSQQSYQNLPQSQSYDDYGNEGYRRPDEQQFQQLVGGDDDYEHMDDQQEIPDEQFEEVNFEHYSHTNPLPSSQTSNVNSAFMPPTTQINNNINNADDNNNLSEEEQMARAIAASLNSHPNQQQQSDVDNFGVINQQNMQMDPVSITGYSYQNQQQINQFGAGEDPDLQRALAASMMQAEAFEGGQQINNNQNDLVDYTDLDEEMARIIEQSKNDQ